MERPRRVEVVVQEGSEAVMPCTAPSAASQSWGHSHHYAHSFQWTKSTGDQSTGRTLCRREKSGLMYRRAGSAGLSKHINCGVDYSLRLRNVREADAGEYACTLAGQDKTIITLRVMRVSFSKPEVTEGEYLTVHCHITPRPPRSAKVSWKLNGEDYATWSSYPKEAIVTKVSQSHRGNWTCLFQTTSKFSIAEQVLKVKGIESPLVDGALVYAGVGSSATLPCVFTQGMAPNVTWTKFSNQSLSSFSSPSSSPSSPSLPRSFVPQSLSSSSIPPWDRSWRLEGVEVGDAGSYRCSGAVGRLGRLVERKMELVTAQVLSSLPSKKSSGLTLTCQLSNDREVTIYEWLRVNYDNASVATITSLGEGRTLKLPVVTTDDIGEWVCRYHGRNGPLGNVTYHLQLMGGLEAGEVEGQSPTSRALVIGLSLLLMLVLLIALQMYRNHRRRQMTLPYPAMENIIHSMANQREEKDRRQMNKKKNTGPLEEEEV
ncbi:hemicentin-2-like [Engraulis encrasicolus]|uniref:hemicentin-2-like n=1 Tax=Engraulis encrasicolus TaxID=184585 RepID=UPI002FD0CE88